MNYSELLQLAKGWGDFISDRIIIWRLLSTLVYTTALAFAPSTEVLNSQFFRPTANGRIAFSLSYSHLKITQRELYTPLCDRPEELAVCRKSEGFCCKCRDIYPGRNSESQWPGCNEIHQVYPIRYARE